MQPLLHEGGTMSSVLMSESVDTSVAPVFIGGAGRSGTTLLRVMLDSHPDISCGPEMKVLPLICKFQTELKSGFSEFLSSYEVTEEKVDVLFRNLINGLFSSHLEIVNKRRWAEKTPHNLLYTGQLSRIFPEARFIHVLRDGRDVAASLVEMQWFDIKSGQKIWYTENIRNAAIYWKEIVTGIRKAAVDAGVWGRFAELRYEDLISDPRENLEELMNFLGEEWDEKLLEYHDQNHELPDEESSTSQVKKALYPSSISRWKRSFTDEDRRIFKETAGELLIELEYEDDDSW